MFHIPAGMIVEISVVQREDFFSRSFFCSMDLSFVFFCIAMLASYLTQALGQ